MLSSARNWLQVADTETGREVRWSHTPGCEEIPVLGRRWAGTRKGQGKFPAQKWEIALSTERGQ